MATTLVTRETETPAWNPMRELQEMSNRMSQLFSSSLWGRQNLVGSDEEALTTGMAWAPAVNVVERNQEYLITADLPAVEKRDIHITMEDGVLCIQGERRQTDEARDDRFHRVESYYGSFVRRFTMPPNADANSVDAKLDQGRLEIHIKKKPSPKAQKAREIAIR